MDFLIYSPKGEVVQEGIISSLDLKLLQEMIDVPKGRCIQEGVPSPPAGINLPVP